MSAWVCHPTHVACLVRFVAGSRDMRYHLPSEVRDMYPEAIAGILHAVNVRSVAHRYPDHRPAGPVEFTERDVATAPLLTPVQAIKAAHCLEYQSCEHPEWRDSLARKVVRGIVTAAIDALPGYSDAPRGPAPTPT